MMNVNRLANSETDTLPEWVFDLGILEVILAHVVILHGSDGRMVMLLDQSALCFMEKDMQV